LPVGAAVWGNTSVDLGFLPAGAQLRNALTGETLQLDASRCLPLAQALAQFPGALLAWGAPEN
jgi:maltooligosyltrehalose synthase